MQELGELLAQPRRQPSGDSLASRQASRAPSLDLGLLPPPADAGRAPSNGTAGEALQPQGPAPPPNRAGGRPGDGAAAASYVLCRTHGVAA